MVGICTKVVVLFHRLPKCFQQRASDMARLFKPSKYWRLNPFDQDDDDETNGSTVSKVEKLARLACAAGNSD